MSSVVPLREFVTERLTAAAEEIFRVFEKTIVEYEEEIDRQRRLLEIVWKPEIKLHRIELPQQQVCKQEEVLTDQQLCEQERNSSLDQEDPDPPQIKEEQEEVSISQEGEQLVLKQETENVMLIPAFKERDLSEPEPVSNQQLLSHSQDQQQSKHEASGSTRNAEPKPKKSCHSNSGDDSPTSDANYKPPTGKKSPECDFCGKHFKSAFSLKEHLRIHTGQKPYVCNICDKRFIRMSTLNVHLRNHSGENLHLCNICGEGFSEWLKLKSHMMSHTDEKPYLCNTCGDRFYQLSHLKNHVKIHTRENMYIYKMQMGEISDSVVS
uniref:C2H2-type domain-containing protein n=1 Tax=Anabas testudineus TaxID=64144 RepID=A0AAQ6IP96_ANATE